MPDSIVDEVIPCVLGIGTLTRLKAVHCFSPDNPRLYFKSTSKLSRPMRGHDFSPIFVLKACQVSNHTGNPFNIVIDSGEEYGVSASSYCLRRMGWKLPPHTLNLQFTRTQVASGGPCVYNRIGIPGYELSIGLSMLTKCSCTLDYSRRTLLFPMEAEIHTAFATCQDCAMVHEEKSIRSEKNTLVNKKKGTGS